MSIADNVVKQSAQVRRFLEVRQRGDKDVNEQRIVKNISANIILTTIARNRCTLLVLRSVTPFIAQAIFRLRT